MPRNSLQAAVDRRLSEAVHGSERFCDLQLDFVDERDGRVVGRLGGRWDRRVKDFVGDAARSRVVRLHPGQLEVAEWFLNDWMDKHLGLTELEDDEDPVNTCLVAGGRRGGKTAEIAWLAAGYAVAVPGSIVWFVVPSDIEGYGDELRQYIENLLPVSWYSFLGAPHWRYDLINGSCIRFLSGFTPRKVKKGRASLVFMNEAQQIVKSTYDHVRASIADDGGLVFAAANPPDEGDPGTWVGDIAAECQQGVRPTARAFFIDPLSNPHIDHAALMSLRDSMSEHEFNVQIRGMFLHSPNIVLHAWDRLKNEVVTPQMGDCTAAFTRKHEGSAYDWIVSTDVQKYPWLVATVHRAFVNPDARTDMNRALCWMTDEVYVDRGDEIDLADGLIKLGLDPTRTLLICDASGDWQQAERKQKFQRTEFKGKGSWDMFRSRGFRHIVGPDRDSRANPDVVERIRASNARISSASNAQQIFVDPLRCPRTVQSIGKWKNKNNYPDRRGKDAHAGDCLTYFVWRFFPRRAEDDGSFDFKPLNRYQGRRRVKGY
jgi:hypothetical protein